MVSHTTEPQEEQIHNLPLRVLNLSLWPYHMLRKGGVFTVGQLLEMTPIQYVDLLNGNEEFMREVKTNLAVLLRERILSGSDVRTTESSKTDDSKMQSPKSLTASPKSIPLDVLGLSIRPYNALMRGGIRTVDHLARLTAEEILLIRNIGEKTFAEIKHKLEQYQNEGPSSETKAILSEDVKDDGSETDSQLSDLSLEQIVSLDALGLSVRPYNALIRHGVESVNKLLQLSTEDILHIRNIGQKSLTEIQQKLKEYQSRHPDDCIPLPKGKVAVVIEEQSWIEPAIIKRLECAPLDKIPVRRLGLEDSCYDELERQGIISIDALLQHPIHELPLPKYVQTYLISYLEWLANQGASVWNDETTAAGLSPVLLRTLRSTTIKDLIDRWFSVLDERDQQVVSWRFGLHSECLTLEEVGQNIEVTRERARQLQKRALQLLSRPVSMEFIHPLRFWLRCQIEEHGGLINLSLAVTAMEKDLHAGEINLGGVARLIFETDDQVKRLKSTNAWGLQETSIKEVRGVQKQLVSILKQEKVPLTVNELVNRFKSSRFYQKRCHQLTDAFLNACLLVRTEIYVDENENCGLNSWKGRRVQEIILALREIGEPVHYSVIAKRANTLLKPEQQTSEHNIHAQIQRLSDIFVRVGHGIYGLKEWGLHDDGSLANAAYRVLSAAGKPLHLDVIAERVLETWRAEPTSVHVAVYEDERFYKAGLATFGLREWELQRGEEKTPVFNICPPPLPDRKGERNTFFESVLVAREVLQDRPTTQAFLGKMLRWIGTDEKKSERYLQNVLNAYYIVGLLPYTVYRTAADNPIGHTLPETDDLQSLRRYCFDCMMERLVRMPEFVVLISTHQPCKRTELWNWFYEPGAPIDDVKNRVRLLHNLGILSRSGRGKYRLSPLGQQIIQELFEEGHVIYNSVMQVPSESETPPSSDDSFDMIELW